MGHIGTNINFQTDRHEIWEKMGCKDRLKMMISWGCNSVLSIANHETIAECLKEIPYIVVYDIVNNETDGRFCRYRAAGRQLPGGLRLFRVLPARVSTMLSARKTGTVMYSSR